MTTTTVDPDVEETDSDSDDSLTHIACRICNPPGEKGQEVIAMCGKLYKLKYGRAPKEEIPNECVVCRDLWPAHRHYDLI